MQHTARITLTGITKTPIVEVEFEAPDDATEDELLRAGVAAAADRLYIEIEPGPLKSPTVDLNQ